MLDSPLIRTLQLLSPEEFEHFRLFVESPIFNGATRYHDTVRLFEHLRQNYPDFDEDRLAKNAVGKSLFPDRKKPAEEVEKAMSELMHILKQFINFHYSAVKGGKTARRSSKKDFAGNPTLLLNYVRQQLALLRFYSERIHRKGSTSSLKAQPSGKAQKIKRTENFFQHLYLELRELLGEQKQFHHFEEYEFSDYHYFRFLVEQEKSLYDYVRDEIDADLNLLAALEELDRFYLHSKLELMSRLVHYQSIAQPFAEDSDQYRRLNSNRDITLHMVDVMRQHGYWQDAPGVELYTTLLQFLPHDGEDADKASDRFAELLVRHVAAMPQSRLDDFNVSLRSYWNRRYRHTKDRIFIGRLHGMHREQLSRLGAQQNVPTRHILNMLSTALKLGKTAWAEQFLREFAGALTEDGSAAKPPRGRPHPRYAVRIWWAMLYFAREEYEKAAQTLPEYKKYSDIDDIYFYAVAGATDIKINYELGTLDDNLVRALLARIERNRELPKERRDERLHFFRAARKLYSLKIKKETRRQADISKDLDDLQDKLNQSPAVDWEWLEEKIQALR